MAKPPELKKSNPVKEAEQRPVDLADPLDDFDLPIADDAEAKVLNINPDTARRVAQAIRDLLARLPQGQPDAAVKMDAGCIDTESCKPQTLPVVVTNMPTLLGAAPVRWRQIKQLPGYRSGALRAMGNDIFSSFPCFREFAEAAAARKFDGHGEVLTISDFTHDQTTVQHIARIIAEKGVLLDIAQLDHSGPHPGYHPRVALLMTETWTFKLVQDRRENGAPADANFIYAWPGGARFYRPKLSPQPNPREQLAGEQRRISDAAQHLALGEA